MTPEQQQRADVQSKAKANAVRLYASVDAISRLETKLQEAGAALCTAEQALWCANFERMDADHRLRSDEPTGVSYLPEQQQIVLMRSKIRNDLEALTSLKKAAYAEIQAYAPLVRSA